MSAVTGARPARDDEDPDADPVEVVREIALRRLEQRDYSRGELSDYLVRRRGCERSVVEAVLDRLEAVDLVDDERFAAAWAASRRRSRGLSARAIARELRTRQVSDEIITGVLADYDHDSESAAALALARSRAGAVRGLERQRAFRRIVGVLARRGYNPSVCLEAATRALDELGEGGEGDGN